MRRNDAHERTLARNESDGREHRCERAFGRGRIIDRVQHARASLSGDKGGGEPFGILRGERFIASEHVQEIRPDRIQVGIAKADMESLPEYEDAPVVRLEPDKPGFFARLFGRR